MRDAEVGEHDAAVLSEQDVRRLHVAVHDALGVRGLQGAHHGQSDPRRLGGRERAAPQHLVERLATDQLHDDPRQSVLHDHVVDRDGAGVVDARGGPRLTLQPVVRALVGRVPRIAGQPGLLDRDVPLHEFVRGLPHGAHAARTDALGQPVAATDQAPPVFAQSSSLGRARW
ncbi:hypothetical protein QF026_003530 [Streptomyces aurantiacus]|nr:hypothetical protein [Streptomyces aurantiacus]